jgi:hypothetical protein
VIVTGDVTFLAADNGQRTRLFSLSSRPPAHTDVMAVSCSILPALGGGGGGWVGSGGAACVPLQHSRGVGRGANGGGSGVCGQVSAGMSESPTKASHTFFCAYIPGWIVHFYTCLSLRSPVSTPHPSLSQVPQRTAAGLGPACCVTRRQLHPRRGRPRRRGAIRRSTPFTRPCPCSSRRAPAGCATRRRPCLPSSPTCPPPSRRSRCVFGDAWNLVCQGCHAHHPQSSSPRRFVRLT